MILPMATACHLSIVAVEAMRIALRQGMLVDKHASVQRALVSFVLEEFSVVRFIL